MKIFAYNFVWVGMLLAVGCQTPAMEHTSILKLTKDSDAQVPPEVLKLAQTDHVALLKKGIEKYDALPVQGYTCEFVKQEKIGGALKDEQAVNVKFLDQPFSVAMVWTKNPPLGDALIYVEGQYKDDKGTSQMLVRPKAAFQWLVGKSVLKQPDGAEAKQNSLRPVTKFGFRNGLVSLLEVYEQALAAGDCTMRYDGVTQVDGRTCVVITRTLPDGKGYPAGVTETCIDVETLLPMRLVGYDWDNSLQCNYEYHNVKLNPGMTPDDFTPQANGIEPPKTK